MFRKRTSLENRGTDGTFSDNLNFPMARLARVVAVGAPHHITQRGNGRQFILTSDAERTVYMELLRQAVQLHSLTVLAYCLMSNHIHLVAIPQKPDSLAQYSERNSRDVTPHFSLLAS
jgi:REP element-mobilizing transposase RayT